LKTGTAKELFAKLFSKFPIQEILYHHFSESTLAPLKELKDKLIDAVEKKVSGQCSSTQGDQSGRFLAHSVVVYSGQLRSCKVQKWTNFWAISFRR
jgi:hypothetical protein